MFLLFYMFSQSTGKIVLLCHPSIQHPRLHIVMVPVSSQSWPLSSQSCLKHVYKAINKLSTVSYCVTIPCTMVSLYIPLTAIFSYMAFQYIKAYYRPFFSFYYLLKFITATLLVQTRTIDPHYVYL